MRKEITGTLLFFLVVLTLISLVSYNWTDPSINHAGGSAHVKNLFGLLGAHIAGFLIGLAGMGAFWIPVLLLIASVHFLSNREGKSLYFITGGGVILVFATGTLLAMVSGLDYYILFENRFPAGGLVGTVFKGALLKYTNLTGGLIIISVAIFIGLILSTGFSFIALYQFLRARLKKSRERRAQRKVKKELEKSVKTARVKEKKANRKVAKSTPAETCEVKIKSVKPKKAHTATVAQQAEFSFMSPAGETQGYRLPTISFLMDPVEEEGAVIDNESLRMLSVLLEKKLEDFGVMGKVSEVSPGPVITTFEYKPAPGVKINKIVNLADDLALALRAISIRIVAPIPGKDAIGIEVPNDVRSKVWFKEIVTSSSFIKSKSPLCMCLGHDIVGNPISAELNKMPHLLIAGATGAGKSVGLNVMISSLLFKSTPDDVRMIMVDPKRIELSVYDGIPHLITPVVTDMKKATNALFWAVREMERRYELLAEHKVRNIDQFNKKVEKLAQEAKKGAPKKAAAEGEEAPEPPEKLPFIVIIIDELADLMMVASRDVEVALTRLAQMARASGIHIILATQRPSVDVLTGIIKANFPTRISFQVSSKTDSRTIIDSNGAENLLGMGDMLYLPPGTAKLMRIHGAFISDDELNELISFWKEQQGPGYDTSILDTPPEAAAAEGGDEDYDEKYDEAVALVTRTRQASISSVQRHLRIGYNRAARIIEAMERDGVIGPADGSKSREILVASYDE
ncbi:DNA translocase FtsK [Desulfoluna spongiiphila]|uniref:DNA translocase FtsK n=1 Tax=Desulfoluna spongiiphila TaxID=419481 RepID=A0A1G5H244_9BACT|nr:DNA translocase FtsK [Desulfoluna spongiiphila]SCY57925.1 DNA translocase FtsK [Desulfoluna spongiiphila]